MVHAIHQRALDHVQRGCMLLTCFLGVLGDVLVDALDQGMLEPLGHRLFAPGLVALLLLAFALESFGGLEQTLGRIRATIQDHVFNQLAQSRFDVVVDRKLAGVDDAEIHSRPASVVQEYRVHRFAHPVVAAKRE